MYQKLLNSYPKSLLQAFGVSTDLGSLSNFLGGELLNVIWPLIASVFVIMAGSALVAQEIERGTVDSPSASSVRLRASSSSGVEMSSRS